jgi:hypothetical protein
MLGRSCLKVADGTFEVAVEILLLLSLVLLLPFGEVAEKPTTETIRKQLARRIRQTTITLII